MTVKKSQSTNCPAEWDTESSPETVYHNFDVVRIPAHDDTPVMFEYTQEVDTRAEYVEYINRDNAERLDLAEAAILAIMDEGVL